MGYVHFVRSPYAHANITAIDVSKAAELEGVYGTLIGEEVAALTDPFFELSTPPGADMKDYALAVGKVRHMGEPVAAVVASSRELARDAAELVEVEYEPLPTLVDAVQAQAGGRADPPRGGGLERRLVRASSTGATSTRRSPRPTTSSGSSACTSTASRRRRSSAPAALVEYDRGTQQWTIYGNHQMPGIGDHLDGPGAAHRHRQAALRLAGHRRRLRQQDLPAPAVRRRAACSRASSTGRCSGRSGAPTSTWRTRTATSATFLDVEVPVKADGTMLGFKVQGDRRLRRLPALRAARLHHLGAGHAGLLPLAQRPRRLHAGRARTSRRSPRTAATRACSTSG